MTRTITVTGGFSGSAVVDVTDSLKQLADSTFRMALCPVGQDDPPSVSSIEWESATATNQTASTATVSIPVDDTTPVGHYNMALDVVADGRHEAAWVADRRNPAQRALVIVT